MAHLAVRKKNTSFYKPPSSLYWNEFGFCDVLKPKKAIECKMYFDQHCRVAYILRASSPGRSGGGAGKGKRACNFATNSTSISPVAPSRLSCHISANQREAETSANVNKRWKIRANHLRQSCSISHLLFDADIQIPERQCKLSFLFPPHRQSAPKSLLAGSVACFETLFQHCYKPPARI